MDDNPRLFYLSGFISLLIFSILLFLFVHMLFAEKKLHTYGLTKKNYISISLKTIPIKAKSSSHKKVAMKKTHKKSVKKRDKVDPVSENVDVDSLFSNVWTKKVDTHIKKKRRVDTKRLAEIEKSISTPDVDEIDSQKSISHSKNKKAKAASSAEEVNEYSAKIHAIVYDHFFPPPNSEGEQVKAVIELSPLGKMLDFRILNYSGSEALNEEVDQIKDRIKNIIFPKNPANENARVMIILKPEAKE